MERNLDLIRDILLHIERGGRVVTFDANTFDGIDIDMLRHHIKILSDAGFIDSRPTMQSIRVAGMTWAGHDFLDATRDETVWKKARTVAGKVTFAAFVSLCSDLAKKAAQGTLGLGG